MDDDGAGAPGEGRVGESERVRGYRLARLQQELRAADCAAAVLYDPINIRYATDARNMQVWTMHVPSRFLFVPADGLPTLFEYRDAEHLAAGLSAIGEIRRAIAVNHIAAGPEVGDRAREWAAQIADLLQTSGGGPLAIDRTSVPEMHAMAGLGLEVRYAQGIVERARSIKSTDEIDRMRASVTVAEQARPFGYNADISRTFLCGSRRRSAYRRTLYALPASSWSTTRPSFGPGSRSRSFGSGRGNRPRDTGRTASGTSTASACPSSTRRCPRRTADTPAYDGVFEAGMVICAESYLTADHGRQGVKLENPMLVGHGDPQPLTTHPFEEALDTPTGVG